MASTKTRSNTSAAHTPRRQTRKRYRCSNSNTDTTGSWEYHTECNPNATEIVESLPSPSIRRAPIQDKGFTHGADIPDVIGSAASLGEDFKLWLSLHPELTFDEARSRYREEQKAKQRRTVSRL